MDQKIEPFSAEDTLRVQKHRQWVQGFFDERGASYKTVQDKLDLVGAILNSSSIGVEETWKLQSLGIVFGDALAQELGLIWVAVEDEYGRDPALSVPGTSLLSFPLTAISKRIEKGEEVDVFLLFKAACQTILDLKHRNKAH
jgi:Domain of unknown function (DUF3806)